MLRAGAGERPERLLPGDSVRRQPALAWKRASAFAVSAVNRPSTAFGLRPNGTSLNSSDDTSQPTAPTPSSRWPRSGRPSGPRAERVACSIRPLGGRPARFWKVVSPARVSGPVDPVDGRRVVAVRAQRHLEGGDAGASGGRSGARESECRRNRGRDGEQAVHTRCVGRSGRGLKRA